jgi:hypothetical protein
MIIHRGGKRTVYIYHLDAEPEKEEAPRNGATIANDLSI